jgi:hypothetical protein
MYSHTQNPSLENTNLNHTFWIYQVRDVSENPLANKHSKFERGVKEADKLIETRLLENAINKICSLLAVGFGDAGAEV